MIKKQDIVDYFWTYGNLITTEKGVELEMHGDSAVMVSVMLRNVEDIEINGLEPMVQLKVVFEDFEELQCALGIERLVDLTRVSVADLLRLYAKGVASMEEIDD